MHQPGEQGLCSGCGHPLDDHGGDGSCLSCAAGRSYLSTRAQLPPPPEPRNYGDSHYGD